MSTAAFRGRRLAFCGLFLLNCLLVGVVIGAGQMELPQPLLVALGASVTGAELSLWLVWAARPGVGSAGVDRFTSIAPRLESARQTAIRVEDSELFRRWYLEFRIKQEAERCLLYDCSMAVIVVRLGSTDLATWSGNFWAAQSSSATQHLLQFVRTTDICAPLGPLEFAILLVQCDRAGAEIAAARIAERLAEQKCEVGVATYPADRCEPLALIELARGRLGLSRAA